MSLPCTVAATHLLFADTAAFITAIRCCHTRQVTKRHPKSPCKQSVSLQTRSNHSVVRVTLLHHTSFKRSRPVRLKQKIFKILDQHQILSTSGAQSKSGSSEAKRASSEVATGADSQNTKRAKTEANDGIIGHTSSLKSSPDLDLEAALLAGIEADPSQLKKNGGPRKSIGGNTGL